MFVSTIYRIIGSPRRRRRLKLSKSEPLTVNVVQTKELGGVDGNQLDLISRKSSRRGRILCSKSQLGTTAEPLCSASPLARGNNKEPKETTRRPLPLELLALIMLYADDLPTVLKFRLLNKGWYAYWPSFAFAACMAPFWKHLDLTSLGACCSMIRVETLRLLLEGNPSRSQRGARQWVETVQVLQHTWDPAKFLGSASIALLISNCPNMRSLDLSGCDKLENLTKTLAIVGRNNGLTFTHGKLETLNLSGCKRLNSTDLCVFLHLFRHLKHLNLTECFNIAQVGFVALGDMAFLEVLSVRDCPQFDNVCIGPLLFRCSRLRELDMSGTKVSSGGWAEVNQGSYPHSGESLEIFVASKMRLSSGREMDWLLRMAKLRKVVMKDIQGLAPRNFERLKNVLICKGYERLEISRAPAKKPLSF